MTRMAKKFHLFFLVVFSVILLSSAVQPAFSEKTTNFENTQHGFTKTKKATGVIMKFCYNEAFTLQDCKERYKGLGWTDRVNVLIYAPGWNQDEDKIERIGTSSNPINVYTDAARVNNIDFSETGRDTGVFMGVVKLTGSMGYTVHDSYLTTVKTPGMTMSPPKISSHDRAVMIATSPQDGRLTVSWEANEDTIVTQTAHYGWRIGEANFEKEFFDINETIKFFIRDADLWKHHREFFTNYVRVYSDSDQAGINVGVRFEKDMEHAEVVEVGDVHLTEPAASSLTKYTPDGKWKSYFWWEPGGVIGVDQHYVINLMVHDGKTDVHEMGLSYDMDIYLNGELLESRNNRYFVDGQGIEPIRFDERGSVKIVLSEIFGEPGQTVDFSFQVAPEAVIKEVVPRHPSFEEGNTPSYFTGYEHPHYVDYLPGEFTLTRGDSSDTQDKLRVGPGDTIYVEYVDITLPKPYTEADELNIVAKTTVLDSQFNFEKSPETEVFVEPPKPSIVPVSSDIKIPDWVKRNASWWVDVKINDNEFAKGIEYLIQEQIIDVPLPEKTEVDGEEVDINIIPRWVRNNAEWWSEGHITDVEFANGIKYLVSTGLIKV